MDLEKISFQLFKLKVSEKLMAARSEEDVMKCLKSLVAESKQRMGVRTTRPRYSNPTRSTGSSARLTTQRQRSASAR